MGFMKAKPEQQERTRDMAKVLAAATAGNIPLAKIEPDQYGKPTRYEHEEIVLSNEHLAMVAYIDSLMNGLAADVAQLRDHANALTAALRNRVIDLTVLVEREKAVVIDLQDTFQAAHARIVERRIEKSNGGNGATVNAEEAAA